MIHIEPPFSDILVGGSMTIFFFLGFLIIVVTHAPKGTEMKNVLVRTGRVKTASGKDIPIEIC